PVEARHVSCDSALYNMSTRAAEANLRRAGLGRRTLARGGTLVEAGLAPGAASQRAQRSSGRAVRAHRLAALRRLLLEDVGRPLHDVAGHVEHAVGRSAAAEGADGRDQQETVARVGAEHGEGARIELARANEATVVGEIGARHVAPGPGAAVASARGPLPFGFGGQTRSAEPAVA